MAIIFENQHHLMAKVITGNLNSGDNYWIQIYSGTQPTLTNFETNWNTNYYYDYSTKAVGSDLLGMYGDVNNIGTLGNVLTINHDSANPQQWILTDSDYHKQYENDGTATWAAIFSRNNISYLTSQTSTTPSSYYFLAPVSDASGAGIVKLASTTISGSLPDLADVSIAVST